MSMPQNVGRTDHLLRAILGVTLVLFALFCPFAARLGSSVVWGSGVVGVTLIATAALGFCPVYLLPGRRR